ncbi:10009_t:CDS:1, partial [Diversispora eburnea]
MYMPKHPTIMGQRNPNCKTNTKQTGIPRSTIYYNISKLKKKLVVLVTEIVVVAPEKSLPEAP